MLEIAGDLWKIEADARCVTTNGVIKSNGRLVMGKGVALNCLQKYPGIDRELGRMVTEHGNVPIYFPAFGIISFPTKNHWRDKSDIDLIERSARSIVATVDLYHLAKIALSRPGCGNGGLCWERQVKPLLSQIFDDRFVVYKPPV